MRLNVVKFICLSLFLGLVPQAPAQAVAGNTDSTFSNLVVQTYSLSPTYSATTYNYTVSVPNGMSSIYIFPTFDSTSLSAGESATTTINSVSHNVTSQFDTTAMPLNVGANTITIQGHSGNGSNNTTYTIIVTRASAVLGTVSTLTNLTYSGGVIAPAFLSATTSYSASVSSGTSSITVTPTFTGTGETVKVNGVSVTSGTPSASISLSLGANTITVVGTAENLTTTTYQLVVTRESPDIWTPAGLAVGARNWLGVASSIHGETLTAVAQTPGYIYNSYDSGATWVQRSSVGAKDWRYVTSSADGVHQAATVNNGNIYVSNDSGATWTAVATSLGNKAWWGIAYSGDGSTLIASIHGGCIYGSTDFGSTWDTKTASVLSSCGMQNWYGVASDVTGSHLAAVISGGAIYTSADAGATWVSHTVAGTHSWISISMSADGTHLIASESGGYPWISPDGGATWSRVSGLNSANWWGVSISGDGTKVVASSATVGTNVGTIQYSGTFAAAFSDITPNFVSGYGYRGLALSGDGTRILASSPSGDLVVSSVPSISIPSISLTASSESATVGTAITSFSILSSGGAISSYTISPAIGNGLSFNTSTGAITGTPTSAAPLVAYTITAWNGGGSASVAYSIEVAAAPTPPSSPSPTSTPDPAQTSSVTTNSTNGNGSVSGGNSYAVTGSFIAPIANITVDSNPLPSGSWVQTPSAVTITMPPHAEGTVLIQIYNGQVPLLAPIPYVYSKSAASTSVPAPTPTPTPTPTPVPATGATGTGTGPTVKPTPTPSSTTATGSGKSASDNSSAKSPAISFGNAQYRLAASQQALLKQFNISPTSTLVLTGYASNTKGGDNLRISLDRALEVKSALLKLYPKLNITVKGLGTAPNPICKSAQNRCVVIQKSQG